MMMLFIKHLLSYTMLTRFIVYYIYNEYNRNAGLTVGCGLLYIDSLQNSLIGPFFVIDFSGSAASNKGMVM